MQACAKTLSLIFTAHCSSVAASSPAVSPHSWKCLVCLEAHRPHQGLLGGFPLESLSASSPCRGLGACGDQQGAEGGVGHGSNHTRQEHQASQGGCPGLSTPRRGSAAQAPLLLDTDRRIEVASAQDPTQIKEPLRRLQCPSPKGSAPAASSRPSKGQLRLDCIPSELSNGPPQRRPSAPAALQCARSAPARLVGNQCLCFQACPAPPDC